MGSFKPKDQGGLGEHGINGEVGLALVFRGK
jgi:hypothetical protein